MVHSSGVGHGVHNLSALFLLLLCKGSETSVSRAEGCCSLGLACVDSIVHVSQSPEGHKTSPTLTHITELFNASQRSLELATREVLQKDAADLKVAETQGFLLDVYIRHSEELLTLIKGLKEKVSRLTCIPLLNMTIASICLDRYPAP